MPKVYCKNIVTTLWVDLYCLQQSYQNNSSGIVWQAISVNGCQEGCTTRKVKSVVNTAGISGESATTIHVTRSPRGVGCGTGGG